MSQKKEEDESNQFEMLCNLYCQVIEQLDEGSMIRLKRIIPFEAEGKEILSKDFKSILEYLTQTIQLVFKQKDEVEQILEKKNSNECSDYEQCLQKLESEVRQHIRVEQQLKLFAETTQERLEQIQKEKQICDEQVKNLENKLKALEEEQQKKENEIKALKKQLTLKGEAVEFAEENCKTLRKQLQQLQQGDQSYGLSSKPTQSAPYPGMPGAKNDSNSATPTDSQKRQKRSISSINDDPAKKYTQIIAQPSFSSSNSNTAATDNSSNHKIPVESMNQRTYTEPPALSLQGEMTKENRKTFEKYASNFQERLQKKDQHAHYYFNEPSGKNHVLAKTSTSITNQTFCGSKQQNQSISQTQQISQANSSIVSEINKGSINSSSVRQKIVSQQPSQGIQSQMMSTYTSTLPNPHHSHSSSAHSSSQFQQVASATQRIKHQHSIAQNGNQSSQSTTPPPRQQYQIIDQQKQLQNKFQDPQLNNSTLRPPQIIQNTHLRNSSGNVIQGNREKSLQNSQIHRQPLYSQQNSDNSSSHKLNGNILPQQHSHSRSVQDTIEPNRNLRTYLNGQNSSSLHQINQKEIGGSSSHLGSEQVSNSSSHIVSQLKVVPSANSINNTQNPLSGHSKYGQIIQQQRSSSSFEKLNPYIQSPQKTIQGGGNGNQNLNLNSSQINQIQTLTNFNNPRSQSMDEFQKGSGNGKQQISSQIHNTYLKQKAAQQMQTSEIISNLMKSFKMN